MEAFYSFVGENRTEKCDHCDDLATKVSATGAVKLCDRCLAKRRAATAQLLGTKRLGVAGVLRKNYMEPVQVLMGRRAKDPMRGAWVVPGGGVLPGESLAEALTREVKEETGLDVYIPPAAWERVYVADLEDRVVLFVWGSVHDPKPIVSGDDLEEVGWFDASALPAGISPTVHKALTFFGVHGCVLRETEGDTAP